MQRRRDSRCGVAPAFKAPRNLQPPALGAAAAAPCRTFARRLSSPPASTRGRQGTVRGCTAAARECEAAAVAAAPPGHGQDGSPNPGLGPALEAEVLVVDGGELQGREGGGKGQGCVTWQLARGVKHTLSAPPWHATMPQTQLGMPSCPKLATAMPASPADLEVGRDLPRRKPAPVQRFLRRGRRRHGAKLLRGANRGMVRRGQRSTVGGDPAACGQPVGTATHLRELHATGPGGAPQQRLGCLELGPAHSPEDTAGAPAGGL